MCIQASVGMQAANLHGDVKIIQVLLNMNLARMPGAAALAEDGVMGTETRRAIDTFQSVVMAMPLPGGRVDPGDATFARLREAIPPGLSDRKLRAIMPGASEIHVQRYFPQLEPTMLAYGINTPLRQSHFLAQIGHESGSLRYCEEIASGRKYERRAALGNTRPGDGPRFKGRGLIQLTGRANYKAYGEAKRRDFLTGDHPRLIATDPQLAVDVACWFWRKKGLNTLADHDDVEEITRRINGALNGFEERKAYLSRSRFFLVPAAERS